MGEDLEARLRDAGISADETLPVGATIRPVAQAEAVADTLIASSAQTLPRALPRLSVDLRASRPSAPPDAPASATDLEVRGVIGEGGMGRVLLARQHSLARDVAVKTAKDEDDGAARAALLAEGAVTGRLEHPGIVPVHALGLDEGGRPAMVMKRIEGVAWRELARAPAHEGWEGWPGDASDRLLGHLQILMQLCNAVHFAHSRGVVHRDIKLENVLIGRFGDVYLADWGVAAKVGEREARLCGTPGYMAPEMASGGPVDERTDVYLLGATLHEILTGELRHQSPNVTGAIAAAYLSEPHTYDERVPTELGALVNRACHADPAERPASAKALREAIAQYLEQRAMAALAREAVQRTERLEALAATESPDLAEMDRLAAEASFGFERALASWEGDTTTLDARARLDALLEERRARTAALERDARDRDPRVSARLRALGLVVLGLVGVVIGVIVMLQEVEPAPEQSVLYPVITYAVLLGGTVALRASMLQNAFNRQVTILLHLAVGLIAVGRMMGLLVDISLAEHFARDSFMLAGTFGVGAIAYFRWVAWIAALYFVSYLVCTLRPELALPVFAFSTSGSAFFAAGFQLTSR